MVPLSILETMDKFSWPSITLTVKVLSTAVFDAPAAAYMSKLLSTVLFSNIRENTLLFGAAQYVSANFNVTSYKPLGMSKA